MERFLSFTPDAMALRADDSRVIDLGEYIDDDRTTTVFLSHEWDSVSDDSYRNGAYVEECTASVIGMVIDQTIPEVLNADQVCDLLGLNVVRSLERRSAEEAEAA